MKKSLLFCFVIVILQSCSSSKYFSKDFKNNRSLYSINSWTVEDIRKYDEYPNIMCQADMCNTEELIGELRGYPRFKRYKNNDPLLTSSFDYIVDPVIKDFLGKQSENGIYKTILKIKISCIGFGMQGLQVTVYGEIINNGSILWKGSGFNMRSSFSSYTGSFLSISDILNMEEDNLKKMNWDKEISSSIKSAVEDLLKKVI